ncbi:MAG TPA: hypothetical protein VGP06_17035, partial [Janthinobacterium sp.]|nr:hypothetical protein [Janthinobacterium sp.]
MGERGSRGGAGAGCGIGHGGRVCIDSIDCGAGVDIRRAARAAPLRRTPVGWTARAARRGWRWFIH